MGAAALYVDYGLLQLGVIDCLCSLLSLGYSPTLKFECLILCELMSMAQPFIGKPSSMLVSGAVNRRDTWSSREEAYRLLKARSWKMWDDRVLKIFVVGPIKR